MSKIIDITDKLNFEEKPRIKIKGEVLTVNNEAAAILKLMPLLEDDSVKTVCEICKILFSESDMRKIEGLKLDFNDFTTLVKNAITVVAGSEGSASGEAVIPATT